MEADRHEQLHSYLHLRDHLVVLHMHLIEGLPRKTIKEARKKLGMHKQRAAEAAEETATVVLIDYVLYHHRPGGRSLFEAFFEAHPPAPGSHDEQLRMALAMHRYTVFEVEGVEQGAGVHAYDVLQERPFFLMDRGLSQSVVPGMLLAANLLDLPEYSMTSGATLPVSQAAFERIERDAVRLLGRLEEVDFETLNPYKQADLAAVIIRHALREQGAEGISYE